ncbi:MAG: hypothetical protein ACLQU5_22475 [Isosphaeraceae bacterium]
MTPVKIGLFGIGLDVYRPQFPGLKERLESYLQRVQHRLEHPGVVVVNLGLIDTPERAFEAGHALRAEKGRREHRNTDPCRDEQRFESASFALVVRGESAGLRLVVHPSSLWSAHSC